MKKPIIAIDIDDTIADATESVRLMANKKSGITLAPEHYRVKGEYWGYYRRVWAEHGVDQYLTFEEHEKAMALDQSEVLAIPGAEAALMRLAQDYDLVLVTSRDPSWEAATRLWLTSSFPEITFGIHFADSHRTENGQTKGQICKQIGAKLLIDDNDDHCFSALEAGIAAIRFGEYGWHKEESVLIPCCKTWQDVLEYIGVG